MQQGDQADALFNLIRRGKFDGTSDPFTTIHETPVGSNNPAPTGWYGSHPHSSFVGQANVLIDPTFETSAGGAIGTSPTAYGEWTTHYVKNSGAVPSPTLAFSSRGSPDGNPFSSGLMMITPGASGACDLNIYVYPTTPFHPNYVNTLDWLVAGLRHHDPFGFADDLDYSTIEAILEIYSGTSTTVVATRTYDLLSNGSDVSIMEAPYNSDNSTFRSTDWYWRFNLHVVTTGASAFFRSHKFGEPQLHFNYQPEALPYQPAVSSWRPVEADLKISDNTTGNVSTSAHGLAPKAPNDAAKFLDGTGAWSSPAPGIASITSAVAVANTETRVVGLTLAANSMAAGSTYRIRASGVVTSGATGGGSTWYVRCGQTTLTAAAVTSIGATNTNNASGLPWSFEALVTCRTAGGSGTVIGEAQLYADLTAGTAFTTASPRISNTTSTTVVDTTAARILELSLVSGNAGTTFTTHVAVIEKVM